jgi:transposase
VLEDADAGLPDMLRPALGEAATEIKELARRMKSIEAQLETVARQTPVVARLRTIPGIGLLSSTAIVAFVGDIQRFPSSRRFASYLGLTPRETSTGLKRRLGAISKRGDAYLRTLLTHGARTVIWHAKKLAAPDRLRAWALRLERERGYNRAAVATANKFAQLAWAV